MERPTPVVSQCEPQPREVGQHALKHIMRIIGEDKLGKDRHWAADRGASQSLVVTMPDNATNVRVTRLNNGSATYSVSPEARVMAQAVDADLHRATFDCISAAYAQLNSAGQLVRGELDAKGVGRILSQVRAMPINVAKVESEYAGRG